MIATSGFAADLKYNKLIFDQGFATKLTGGAYGAG